MKRGATISGRPELRTSYRADMALLNSRPKRLGAGVILAAALAAPFLITDALLAIAALACAAAIGAIGLNLVSGYAGQVSLGHAFFIGAGAFTAAALTGDPGESVYGLGLQWIVAVPAAGLVAAVLGFLVSPIASRFRGLYLAIATLGLVFLGEHILDNWRSLTGGAGAGRRGVIAEIGGVRLDQPTEVAGLVLTTSQQLYLLALVLLVVLAVLARNLARSAVGRAFEAIRDRDIAAEVMGVRLGRHKMIAFTLSSFYAGVSGAVYYTVINQINPESFNLLLSVQFIAMVLIGGIATISGSIMGAFFITFLPRITRELPAIVPFLTAEPTLRDGALLTVFQLEAILYGVLIVGFLILEPRGLYGLWVRVRNYWKGWPFTY